MICCYRIGLPLQSIECKNVVVGAMAPTSEPLNGSALGYGCGAKVLILVIPARRNYRHQHLGLDGGIEVNREHNPIKTTMVMKLVQD